MVCIVNFPKVELHRMHIVQDALLCWVLERENLRGPLGFCLVAVLVLACLHFLAFVAFVLFGTVIIYYIW